MGQFDSCTAFLDCDSAKLSLEQLFKLLITDDGSGCPAFKTISQGGGGGAGATEITLQAVLASLNNGKEFETVLVKDNGAGGITVRQVLVFDTDSGTFNPPIYYDMAGAIYVPLGPLAYIDNTVALNNILLALSNVNTTPGLIQSVVNGNTPVGVKSFSIVFRGTGGSLNGVSVPNNYEASFGNGKDLVTVAMPYIVPTAGELRVIISSLT